MIKCVDCGEEAHPSYLMTIKARDNFFQFPLCRSCAEKITDEYSDEQGESVVEEPKVHRFGDFDVSGMKLASRRL